MVHNARSHDYDRRDMPPSETKAGGKSYRGMRSARMLSSDYPGPMPLHNFTLPRLGWGRKKLMKSFREVDCSTSSFSGGERYLSVSLPCDQARFMDDEEEGIEDVSVKLILNLRAETDKFKEGLLKGQGKGDDVREEEETAETSRPWNLRTRSAACRGQGASDGPPVGKLIGSQKKRDKFSVALKGKEIEEDFVRMMGHRPPRRPRKRNKAVQKQLDMLFPGLWLTEVTADVYKVVEVTKTTRRER
ncbi:hypothetical protein MLD38_017505 [Melastoma candidum]|uniref:Uncharacterized protein n=1 Tax=Melastoma candidum TaxID=119954 RepID=A0ACB9QQX5_9MYRT|nr:hypothetical protein MLD38_017505 [Melastoma candidum]